MCVCGGGYVTYVHVESPRLVGMVNLVCIGRIRVCVWRRIRDLCSCRVAASCWNG